MLVVQVSRRAPLKNVDRFVDLVFFPCPNRTEIDAAIPFSLQPNPSKWVRFPRTNPFKKSSSTFPSPWHSVGCAENQLQKNWVRFAERGNLSPHSPQRTI